ncbi:MAG: T9SS type A sorting domain-containing protein [Flavobacterium sp.]|nr:T9SS type A sorting domain-containing protein [Flavobacterium sp.]
MKNYYCLLITLCLFSFTHAQIVAIPDLNFKNKLLQASYNNNIALDQFGNSIRIDSNNDGEIQKSELTIIRVLIVSGSGIANLTGIEAFPVLNELYCNDNSLTNLNVSALTYLMRLDCNNNQLTSLNVLGLINVHTLNCENNKLTSLNVSGITALNRLYCDNNFLTTLNVSGLANLYWVYCSNNLLTSINFSGSPNLSYLYCTYNKLTNLNVSELTNMIELDCSYNASTSLTISGLTKLQILNCSNNLLTNLNVSGFSDLTTLDCSFNQLTDSNLVLSGNTKMDKLFCQNNLFTNLVLTDMPNLVYLYCYDCKLISLTVSLPQLYYLFFQGNPNLSVLNLTGCKSLSSTNYTTFNEYGTFDVSNGKLTSLNLSGCSTLRTILCNNNVLTSLILDNKTGNGILNCSNNKLTSLNIYTNIGTLDCSQNQLSTIYFAPELYLYKLILNLSGNLFTDMGFLSNRYDAQYISGINCSNNLFSDVDLSKFRGLYGWGLICDNNTNLTTLNLKNGAEETYNNHFSFANNPNLRFVCQDSFLLNYTQNLVTQYGYTNCVVGTDCELGTYGFGLYNYFTLYPNPVNNLLTIDVNEKFEIKNINVFNTLGQLVLAIPDAQKVKIVDVSGLVTGTYFMKINSDKGTVSRKFVRE